MGKKDVIKPGHFKLAGRVRPGKDHLTEQNKQKFAKSEESAGMAGQAPAATSSPQTGIKSGVQSTSKKMDTASSSGFDQQPSAAHTPGASGEEQEKDSATRKGRLKTKRAGGS